MTLTKKLENVGIPLLVVGFLGMFSSMPLSNYHQKQPEIIERYYLTIYNSRMLNCINHANKGRDDLKIGGGLMRTGIFPSGFFQALMNKDMIFTISPGLCLDPLGFKIKGLTAGISRLEDVLDWKLIDYYVLTGEIKRWNLNK